MYLGIERGEIRLGWRMLAEHGVLPYSGGWAQQPAPWIEAIDIVEAATQRVRAEQAAAAHRQE